MNNVLYKLKNEAKELTTQYQPHFYIEFASELSYSRETFFNHPLILRCSEDVLPFLNDDYGHGIEHSKKVAIEAGAVVLGEFSHENLRHCRHLVLLVQLAGLLHDICRMEPDHAYQGSYFALRILQDFPISDKDKEIISFAIRNHEAFKSCQVAPDHSTGLVSNALYDADKFRWGPDNFVTTLWEICDYQEWTLEKILEKFPHGIQVIHSISNTFRTSIGQIYGPEFIEIGLEIGNYLYRRINQLHQQQSSIQ